MFCSRCGKANRDDARFCKSCASPFAIDAKYTEEAPIYIRDADWGWPKPVFVVGDEYFVFLLIFGLFWAVCWVAYAIAVMLCQAVVLLWYGLRWLNWRWQVGRRLTRLYWMIENAGWFVFNRTKDALLRVYWFVFNRLA
jgi:hypothetical protein